MDERIELLKNKSIDDIIRELGMKAKNADAYLVIEVFLNENNINNYYDLYLLISDRDEFRFKFINSNSYLFDIFELESYVYNYLASKVYQLINFKDNSNIGNLSFMDYVDYGFEDYDSFASTFTLTDNENTIDDLWIRSPFRMSKELGIPNISIYDIKSLLREANESDSINCLVKKGMDDKLVKILIKSLKPYTEQVIRQCIDLGDEGIGNNLLKVNQREKIGFIYGELDSIVEYLMYAKEYQGGEFIFGKLSDFDKRQLELIGKGIKGSKLNERRNAFVKTVADTFTLTELKNGIFCPNEDIIFEKCSELRKIKALRMPISRLFQEK